ncbi:MAG: aminoglycoside phosphotransferase family protein [Solirubrobacteraceae bacterium]
MKQVSESGAAKAAPPSGAATSASGYGPFVRLRWQAWEQMAKDRLDDDARRRFDGRLECWELRVSGPPFAAAGAADLVVPVARRDGSGAVLKLNPDDEEVRHEDVALRAFDGDGAVRLLESDRDSRALLLERLTPGTPLEAHGDSDEAITIVCGLLRRLWRAAPVEHQLPAASELARRLRGELPARYERAGRPFEQGLFDAALAACEELGHPAGKEIIANRDIHLGNVLAAQREPWLLIDPQPVLGEPAFDLAYLAQDLLPRHPRAADLGAVLDRLTGELEVSPERVRLWMLVREVDNTLEGMGRGAQWGSRHLAIARLLAEAPRRGIRHEHHRAPAASSSDQAGSDLVLGERSQQQ